MMQRTPESEPFSHVGEIQPDRREGIISWGREISLGDCAAPEVDIGNLHFRAFDFSAIASLSGRHRIFLENIGPQGRNHCALLHMVAGKLRDRGGKRNGVPILSRVLGEASDREARSTPPPKLMQRYKHWVLGEMSMMSKSGPRITTIQCVEMAEIIEVSPGSLGVISGGVTYQ